MSKKAHVKMVGTRIPRTDSRAKATGRSVYANDMSLAKMIWGKVLRSPHARAKIRRIDTSRALSLPGVFVYTASDIPGENRVGVLVADQPVLAQDAVRYHGEAVALIGAETEEQAEDALDLIEVDYDPQEPVTSPEQALADDAPLIYKGGNLAGTAVLYKGDVTQGFAESEVVVEGVYRTQWVEHAYIEPEASLARPEPDGRVTVWTSTQHVHYDRRMIAKLLGISQGRVQIIQTVTGGGFGGKIWSFCPYFPALLAYLTGKPAKMVYTRDESILSTTKRHPYIIHYKTGADKQGKLKAVEVKLISDTGAYMVVGSSVLSRSVIQAAGPYCIPNIKVDAQVAYTNNPIGGAMRGYGGPQVTLAHELQMDKLARFLGMDPLVLREKNALKIGQDTSTGQVLEHSVGLGQIIRKLGEVVQDMNQNSNPITPTQKRGVGVAIALHGVGSSRGGSQGTAFVNLLYDGSASVVCGSVDVGQGSDTIFAQIAADELGISVDKVRVVTDDSNVTPDCESTSGSRVTYISGKAVQLAAQNARDNVLSQVADFYGCELKDLELNDGIIYVHNKSEEKLPISKAIKMFSMQGSSGIGSFVPQTVSLDPESGLGSPCAAYSFAGVAAEVAVDEETGQIDLLRVTNIIDVGRAINPLLVEGQIEGGTSMGVGYALMEEIKTENAQMRNPNFTDYNIPTALDVKKLQSMIVEDPEPSGPFQAKGFSESTVIPVAPAVLNAVYDAVGIRIDQLPATAERVLAVLKQKAGSELKKAKKN